MEGGDIVSSTDSRIVTIKFDNAQFKREATATQSALTNLKNNMNFSGASATASRTLGSIGGLFSKLRSNMSIGDASRAVITHLGGISGVLSRFGVKNPFANTTQGLADLQKDANTFSLQGLTGGITEVNKGWLAMATVAVSALSQVTTAAVSAGAQWAKSLTLDPIIGGFQEYETNLNSIQTILANTGLKGQKGLDQVNGALSALNHYSDKTIYNFSEMARNIGTFTAAGVDLDTSVSSIKGIANLAAISGSNSQQASTAMYQLSQALASGKVSLMDWNSVVNAGMGGKVFQEALTRTAQTMGTLNKNAIKTTGPMKTLSVNGKSFRESISSESGKSWLTSDVLTKTLSQLSGDMTDAQLKAQGFTDAQVKSIQEMAKTGVNAATKVKTLTQLMDTMKEAVGSGWAKTFQILFGDFGEAKKMFTEVSNVLGGMIQKSSNSRNKLLQDFKDLGGRDDIIKGISNAFHALLDVLQPIGDAFHDIFPPATAQGLKSLSEGFVRFTKGLSISDETAANLKRTFQGVFAIFHIALHIIGGVIGMFGRLGGAVSDSSGGFLDFTGGIGEFLTHVDYALTKGGALSRFFKGLGDILAVPLRLLRTVAGWIGKLFSGFSTESADVVKSSVDGVHDALQPVSKIGREVGNIFGKLGGWMADAAKAVGNALGHIGDAIAKSIGPGSFNKALDVVNTALIGGILLLLKNFFTKGITNIDLSGGLFESVKSTLGAVTTSLEQMQTSIKADILMKIAIALGILTAAIAVLSSIDPKDLAVGLGGLATGFAGMQIALISLSKTIGFLGAMKLPFIAAGLMKIALAMLAMAFAIKIMSGIELGDMLRGLAGLGGALFIIAKSTKAMPDLGPIGMGLLLIGGALNLMAIAMKIMATMSWEDLGKGLAGMAGALGIVAGALRLMPKKLLWIGAGLLVVGGALNLIATSMKIFGSMGVGDIAKALVALGGSLVIVAGAMNMMPLTLPITALGLLLTANALVIMSGALKIMGGMSWGEIAKSLVVLAGSLAILSVAMDSMVLALPGAAALLVVAAALAILVPELVAMGMMSWEGIAKSLITLAGALTIIGVAGALLTPVIPSLLGLGAALILLGAGIALAGAGALGFATAFTEVVAVGQQGVRIFSQIIGRVVKSIPNMMKAFGKGLSGLAKEVRKAGPDFAKAWASTLGAFLQGIIKNAPKMAKAFLAMLDAGLKVLVNMSPKIARAGLQMMIDLLQAISDKLPRLIDLGADVVTKFLNGLSRNNQKVVNAGIRLVIDTINDMADAIQNHSEALGQAGAKLGIAIVEGIGKGIAGAAKEVMGAVGDLASNALDAAKNFLGIHSPSRKFRDEVGKQMAKGMADGIKHHKSKKHVKDAIVHVSRDALKRARKFLRKLGGHHNLLEDLFHMKKRRHHNKRQDEENDPLHHIVKTAHKHKHKHERELSRVSQDSLHRVRMILRKHHKDDLADALKPRRGKHHKITPVLDLGKVKKQSKGLNKHLGAVPINPHVSTGRARYLSADKAAMRESVNQATPADTGQPSVVLNQYNNSPKALNPVEMYRNTNNQLQKAKEALKKKK